MVDHRDDWTYALVIPRGHPLEELRATQSYREVHEALAAVLRAQGLAAVTKPAPAAAADETGPAGVCFQRAEVFDVIDETSGGKIAGAAQKRDKHGLLFQGSIWRPAVEAAGAVDWDRFATEFVVRLAAALGATAEQVPWPEWREDEASGLTEQYSTPEWNEYR